MLLAITLCDSFPLRKTLLHHSNYRNLRLLQTAMITYCLRMKSAKETNDLKAFGRRLAELRKAQGLTQETLAEKAGMAPHSLALIEQGQRWPRLTSLHRMAKCIGVDTHELLRGLKQ